MVKGLHENETPDAMGVHEEPAGTNRTGTLHAKESACTLLFLLAANCGKNETDKLADTYCAALAPCCAQANLTTENCGMMVNVLASMHGGDEAARKACLDDVDVHAKDRTFCAGMSSWSPSPCRTLLGFDPGKKKQGEACEASSDCALSNLGRSVCLAVRVSGEAIATCQVLQQGKAGDAPCVGNQSGDDPDIDFPLTMNSTPAPGPSHHPTSG